MWRAIDHGEVVIDGKLQGVSRHVVARKAHNLKGSIVAQASPGARRSLFVSIDEQDLQKSPVPILSAETGADPGATAGGLEDVARRGGPFRPG